MKNTKLVLGIPSCGTVDWRFASSLMALRLLDGTRIVWSVRTMIDAARNNIVKAALEEECTHVLMIDDDMTFEPDFALKLLEHDVDIVGGLAFKRVPDFMPCVFKEKEPKQFFPILPTVFQEVDAIGSGGILIKREVFEKITYPWFETYYDDTKRHWSVDMDFCIKAKKTGFKIFVDPACEMGHMGNSQVIKKEHFLNYNKPKSDTSQ